MRPVSITPLRLLVWAVIAAGVAGVGLALADARWPLRGPMVLLFLVAAPALAVAGLLRGMDSFARIFAACAAMVVVNVLFAETMLAVGAWSPDGGLIVIVVITAVIAVVQLPPVRGRASRHRRQWHAAIRRMEGP